MYSFMNDYSEGAHPRILDALAKSNLEQTQGYGEDRYTKSAVELLKQVIGLDDIDVHLFAGGTQTNLTALGAWLRPHEAVVAPNTGHILVHETGAIEAIGHRVISIEVGDGKIGPTDIQAVLDAHTDEHMVKPRLVYISNSTEIGSIYSKGELERLSGFCKTNHLYLYVDGARLGSALCSEESDLRMSDLAQLADAFYIGGTKNGALLGEALIIRRGSLKADFRYHMKQRGALMAKGRLLGIQFHELFRDGLFFDLAKHANAMASLMRNAIHDAGHAFLTPSPTNQIFPILPNWLIDKLQERYAFYVWTRVNAGESAIRLVTSWATREEAVSAFVEDFRTYVSEGVTGHGI